MTAVTAFFWADISRYALLLLSRRRRFAAPPPCGVAAPIAAAGCAGDTLLK